MGIHGFFGQYIRNNARVAVLRSRPRNVSSLSVDMNAVIHTVVNRVYAPVPDPSGSLIGTKTKDQALFTQFKEELKVELLRIVDLFDPEDVLILAIDGVCGKAKQQQQRKRRFKAGQERKLGEFDRNTISPGTPFMADLDVFLTGFIKEYRSRLPNKVIYSSHLAPGEGEHKIADYFRSADFADLNGSHILFGADADLLVISMLCPIKRIYIAREEADRLNPGKIILDYISIDALSAYIQSELVPPSRKAGENGEKYSPVHDFALIIMLIGNDFLPHEPCMNNIRNGIERMISVYNQVNLPLTETEPTPTLRETSIDRSLRYQESRIRWSHFAVFLKQLAVEEKFLLNDAFLINNTFEYPSKSLAYAIKNGRFDFGLYRSHWYFNVFSSRNKTLSRKIWQIIGTEEEKKLLADETFDPLKEFNRDTASSMINDLVDAYVTTIAWVYQYYTAGPTAVNFHWAYPYHHVPLISDIAAYLSEYTKEKIRVVDTLVLDTGSPNFSVLHQLLSVLPIQSKSLVPKEMLRLFEYNSPIYDLLPSDFENELDGVNQEYRGTVIIPLIDDELIFDIMATVPLPSKDAGKWAETSDLVDILPDVDLQARRLARQTVRSSGVYRDVPLYEFPEEHPKEPFRRRGRGRGNLYRKVQLQSPPAEDRLRKTNRQGQRPFEPSKTLAPTKIRRPPIGQVPRPIRKGPVPFETQIFPEKEEKTIIPRPYSEPQPPNVLITEDRTKIVM